MQTQTHAAYADASSVQVKTPAQLSDSDRATWAQLRASNPALYSPYFHIEYTDLLASIRDDVSVVCVYEGEAAIAFLAFQGKSFARPVGAPMTDYHGFICAPETELDIAQVLKSADIGVFHFGALVDTGGEIAAQTQEHGVAIDISKGADAWREAQDGSYRRHIKSYKRRVRRAEKELGPVTLELLTQDQDIFDTMVRWKREQFAQTGKYDVLGAGWTLDMLQTLLERGPKAALRCDMFALRINGVLAAVDMGLSDGVTYHSWMVTYNKDMHHLSPGIQLLEGLLSEAQGLGYKVIDLGVGIDGYKRYYADMDVPVSAGFIAVSGPAAALSKVYNAAESFTEKAPLGPISKLPGKFRRRYSQIAACDPTMSGRSKAMLQAFKSPPKPQYKAAKPKPSNDG